MERVLFPPKRYGDFPGPLVFLAGPIQGAVDWQAQAVLELGRLQAEQKKERLWIANPRAPDWHGDFEAQVSWEHAHLARASKLGVILFWLAKEVLIVPGRSYAQTTRFELAWHVMRHACDGTHVVVGIEPGFTGERYLRRTIPHIAPDIPIVATLPEACAAAAERAFAYL